MTIIDPARDDISAFRDLCGGAVALPGDDGYDAARQAFNLAVDQRPAAVAYPADASEVAEVVRCARAAGLRVAAQSTGHNAGPLGDKGAPRVAPGRPALARPAVRARSPAALATASCYRLKSAPYHL